MILPLGDAPNPRGVPVVTYALVAINVAVYLSVSLPLGITPPNLSDPALPEYVRLIAESVSRPVSVQEILARISAYDLFVYRHGFRPDAPSVADLFFSLFLHAGFLHLAGNMLFLWIYGDNVEHHLGGVRYLLAYLGTGAVATLSHAALDFGSSLPLVGASGAISGVLGFYFRWFPRNRVRILVLLFPFFLDVVTVPARILLGLYLVLDNLLPLLITPGGGGGVAYGAHLGGFACGLAAAWWLDHREETQRPPEYRRGRFEAEGALEPAALLRRAIADGHYAAAANIYFALPADSTRRLLDPEDSLALGDWLRRNGHARAALTVYRRHLRDYPEGRSAAEAHFGAGIVQFEAFGQATAAYQHFLDALELNPSPETAARIRAALDAIAARQKLRVGRSHR